MDDLFIRNSPKWYGLEPKWPTLNQLPCDYYGFELIWPEDISVPPVFIDQYTLQKDQVLHILPNLSFDTTIFIFGYRINFDNTKNKVKELEGGHIIEYKIVEYASREIVFVHHLKQGESVTYSSFSETNDYRIAKEISSSELKCFNKMPNWKSSEACWPLLDGKPMAFLAQTFLPENDLTKSNLTWDEFNYLFVGERIDSRLAFKITTQAADLQTAEEHYRLESDWRKR